MSDKLPEGVVRVQVKRQDVVPAPVLKRMVGTRWWKQNCHGAETLKQVPGVENPLVQADFSRFTYNGVLGTLPHVGVNAWLKDTVLRADAGKAIRQSDRMLDMRGFVPDPPKRLDPRTRAAGGPGRGEQVRCNEPVAREDDGAVLKCYLAPGHEGDHKPRAKRVRHYGR